jgi:hypothetical protein
MSRRIPALVLLVAAIALAFVVEEQRAGDAPEAIAGTLVQPGYTMPVAAPVSALSSTWYCAAGSANDERLADHRLVIANPSDREVTGTITVFTGAVQPRPAGLTDEPGAPATTATTAAAPPVAAPPREVKVEPLVVGAHSVKRVRLGDIVNSPLAAALVEVDGGEVAVDHDLAGSLGRDTAPCATSASPEWSVPWGVTTRDAQELLVLFNPFAADATVDISFATEAGTREPVPYQGFVVPAHSVIAFDVAEPGVADRSAQVSTHIVARSGRVVVDRIQSFDGSEGVEGMSVGLGGPSPAETWSFPDGRVAEGITERVVVYNPTERPAEVDVAVLLDDPAANGTPEPFELTVPPKRFSVVALHDEDRIPDGISHAIIVRSLNGVGIVAERALTVGEPSEQAGVSSTLGSPLAAPRWVMPTGAATPEVDEWLVILNESPDAPARLSVQALASGQLLDIEGLQDLVIPPSGRVALRIYDHIERGDLALLVTADTPVIVERGLYRVGTSGISNSFGVPLAEGIVVPAPQAGR